MLKSSNSKMPVTPRDLHDGPDLLTRLEYKNNTFRWSDGN